MTKATDAVPNATDPSAEPSPPVTASKGKLPKVSEAGGAWNDALLGGIVQVAAGTDLHGDDVAAAVPRVRAAVDAMIGIGPDDVIADVLASQIVASHTLAMDCYKRAAGGGELAVWREALNQANRLSRTSAALIEALNRHRGKGSQQRVVVEHVNVAAGGQAIVGAVESGGGGRG